MRRSFTFNDIRKNNVFILKGKELPVMAPRIHQLITVPKRPGAIHKSTTTEIRVISLPVLVKKRSDQTFPQIKEELAAWLTTEEAAPLILDEDTERTYFALLDSIENFNEVSFDVGTTVIRFICPDPYKYSDEKLIKLFPNASPITHNVEVLGNLGTYPVTRLQVQKKLNFFRVSADDNYLQVGDNGEVDVPKVEPETLVYQDSMATTTGWGQATYVDNGYISGSVATDGSSLYPDTFGTVVDPPQWQGPAVKKSIGQAVSDFRAEALVEIQNKGSKTGMIEIYFLDSANQTVAKMGIQDRHAYTESVRASARVGDSDTGKWIAVEEAKNPEWWTNFKGVIRIERKERRWTVYFSTIDSKGNHTYPRGTNGILNYYDGSGAYENPITQVQVAFRIYPNTENAVMKVSDLKVWQLNNVDQVNEVPYIADVGDVLEMDHYRNIIRKNGEIMLGLKDFASNFFPLEPGKNLITFSPSDAGEVTLSFRERYL